MFPLTLRAADPIVSGTPAQELCAAAGLDGDLGERLLLDPSGQPFVPTALEPTADPAGLAELMALLARTEPVGGAEPLVRANQRRLREAFAQRLQQRLIARVGAEAPAVLLGELLAELRRRRDQATERQAEAEAAYARVQESLSAWQDAGRAPQGLFGAVGGWLLGGPSQMALPQAVGVWSQREQLFARRLACAAGAALLSELVDELATLLDNQQALAAVSRGQAEQARMRLAALARDGGSYAPWDWQGDLLTMAEQLAGRADRSRLLGQLLSTLGAPDGLERLGAAAEELAGAEAERVLAGLDFAGLVEAEAAASADLLDGADPLVLIGRQLLGLLAQRPGWRLARTARPRGEMVQVTADGRPLFRLDGLQTAAYEAPVDRLAFLRVEQEVTVDELWLLREGEQEFAAALALRNLFVLDDLALAWEERGGEHAARPGPDLPVAVERANGVEPPPPAGLAPALTEV